MAVFRESLGFLCKLCAKTKWRSLTICSSKGYAKTTGLVGGPPSETRRCQNGSSGVDRVAFGGLGKGSGPKSAKHPKGRSGFWDLTPFPPPAALRRKAIVRRKAQDELGEQISGSVEVV